MCSVIFKTQNGCSPSVLQVGLANPFHSYGHLLVIRRPLPSLGLGGAAPGITVGVQHGAVPALSFSMAPSKLQKLQKLLSGTFSATCQGSTSCLYWASKLLRGTFWAPSKSFESLAAAFEGLWTAKPSAATCEGVPPLCHGTSRGPTSCLYWASKLLRGTFWAPLKSFKSLAAAFEVLWTAKPSAAACEGVPPLYHGTSRGPTSCLYWASKLLRGTFWAPLKSFKSLAEAFEGLWTAKPSAAACEGVPPLYHGTSQGVTSSFYWASKLLRGTFWAPLKRVKSPAAACEGLWPAKPSAAACEGIPPLYHGTSQGLTSSFYWASKLLRGTFWAPLKRVKSPAAACEGLWPAKPSAAACEGIPPLYHGTSQGLTSSFYWALKLLRGTFWAPLNVVWPIVISCQ